MAETTLQLGFVPKNRGEYQSTPVTRYYKDNVVQYNGSSYIANPVGWSESDPTATYVTIPPTDASGNLNAGWKVFASGNNTFTTGEKVDNVGIDSEPITGSDNLVESGGVAEFYGNYIENPEWVRCVIDAEGKILYGVKTDGNFYFGAGCPPQIVEFINKYNLQDIVSFLNGLEEGSKNLDTLLSEKVDKVQGKSIIDSIFSESVNSIENSEFLEVKTDNNDKVIEGIKKDGSRYFGLNVLFNGNTELRYAQIQKALINELLLSNSAWTSVENKIVTDKFLNKTTTDKFSEQNGVLLWNGSPIESDSISTLVVDLPISDGTGILSGNAYIDNTTRTIKVKE